MFKANPNSKNNLSGMKVRKSIDKLTVGPTEGKIQEMLSSRASNKGTINPSKVASPNQGVALKKKRKLNLMAGMLSLLLITIPSIAHAQAPGNPCGSTANIKFAVINITTATTTKLIDNGTNPQRQVLVCGYDFTVLSNATAQTLIFNQGTGATCGTGTVALTGAMSGGITDTLHFTNTIPFGMLIAGNSLCAISSSTPTVAGIITYVFMGQATP